MGITPVEFINYNGETIKVSPLSLLQHEELASYLRYVYMEEAKKQAEGLPPKLFEFAWNSSKAKADKIYPGTREHAEAFNTTRGCIYTLKMAANVDEDKAVQILEKVPEAYKAIAKAVGFSEEASEKNPKPLPVETIIHVLTNPPYSYTPKEVRSLTLDEIAAIWKDPSEPKQKLTQEDQQRILDEHQRKRRLGFWAEENIWN